METLLPVKSDRCNLRKRRSERARKTLDRISKRRPGFGRRLSERRSSASPLAHTGSPTLGASADRGCSSKFPAGMARSVYPRAFEGLVRAGPIEMLNLHTRTHQRAFLESWRGLMANYTCECWSREWRRFWNSVRMTQLNKRALSRGRAFRVARAANTAPFRPSQQIPMVPRTDMRCTPAPSLQDNY
jgi:hypothetical protein